MTPRANFDGTDRAVQATITPAPGPTPLTERTGAPVLHEQTYSEREAADAAWKPLYTVGGVAALLSVVVIVVAIPVYLVSLPPTNVVDWFKLFHRNGLLGLLDFDLLMIIGVALSGLVYFALLGALRRVNQPVMALAAIVGFVGITAYVSSNTAFNMLSLSDKYYAAGATDAQRTQLLAAGQAMIAIWQGTAYDVGYILGGVAMLIIAVVMLRSNVFGKVTAYVGLVLGVTMLLPATAGTVGLVLSLVSLVPTVVWNILVARRLFQLAAVRRGGAGGVPAYALEARSIYRGKVMSTTLEKATVPDLGGRLH